MLETMEHEFEQPFTSYEDAPTEFYDGNGPNINVSTANQRRFYRPTLRRAIWESLSKDDQEVWDKLSAIGKQNIISGLKNPSNSEQPKKTQVVNVVEQEVNVEQDTNEDHGEHDSDDSSHDLSVLINSATRGDPQSKMDVRQFLSTITPSKKKKKTISPKKLSTNLNETTYNVSQSTSLPEHVLVDRGANGGIAGENVRVIATTDRRVSVSGIDNHTMNDLNIVSVGGVIKTQRGLVLGIFHQYAHNPLGKTIHSSVQLEDFKNKVDERSIKVQGATQSITTLDGYIVPLQFKNGLPYMHI